METVRDNRIQPGFWIGLFMIIAMLVYTHGCKAQTKAQYDTVIVKNECVKQFVTKQTNSGKTKIYAVYADKNISDLIPVSQTVFDYIVTCKKYGVRPSLAIKLRNGRISSMIHYQPTYVRRQ